MRLSAEEQQRQEQYRDARYTKQYDNIWQSVGKCVFCDLRNKYIVYEENGIVLTVSLFAYIDGNLMIIPRRHVRSAKDLTEAEWSTIRKFTYLAKRLIREVHGIKGVQYVLRDGGIVAQSTVSDHLHFHAIPFDAPDLCTWNYRKLKYTPVENAELYRRTGKKLLSTAAKFEDKYRQPASLPLACDLILVNTRGQLLVQERAPEAKFTPDTYSLPGGRVEDFSRSLEEELAREVSEETGLALDPAGFKLLASRPQTLHRLVMEPHLGIETQRPVSFLWNTYLLTGFEAEGKTLTPGDDCRQLQWIDLAEAKDHPKLSDGVKQTLRDLTL